MKIFGMEHLIFIIFSIFTYLLILYSPKLFKLKKEIVCKILAWLTLIGKTSELIYQFFFTNQRFLDNLPLHLCDIAHILAIYMLFTGNYKVFEVLYFWSIGAVIALITPDIAKEEIFFRRILFFLNHTFIIVGVSYLEKYYDYRPYVKSMLKSYKILMVYSIPVMIFNFIFHTNFLFLMRKPVGGSLMDYLGPWPYYIISLFFVTFIIFNFVYFKYFFKDRVKYLKWFEGKK